MGFVRTQLYIYIYIYIGYSVVDRVVRAVLYTEFVSMVVCTSGCLRGDVHRVC